MNKRVYTETQASCSKCKEMRPLTDFYLNRANRYRVASYCKKCHATDVLRVYHKRLNDDPNYRDYIRNQRIKYNHGITLEEYEAQLKRQDSRCAICETVLKASGVLTHLDHDHATGKHREILCTNCNRGLGHFKDSHVLLGKAKNYLLKHMEVWNG